MAHLLVKLNEYNKHADHDQLRGLIATHARSWTPKQSTTAMTDPSFLSASAEASGTAAALQRNRQNRRKPRASSTVYTSFSPKQIAGFKEAFALIDTDSDGLISPADMHTMLSNLGAYTCGLLLWCAVETSADV